MIIKSTLFFVTITLTLTACGNTDHPAHFLRTHAPAGPASARTFGQKTCLNLTEVLKTADDSKTSLILHSRDYELGTVTGQGEPRFAPVATDASRQTRAHHVLKGAGAPVNLMAKDLTQLKAQTPVAGLLAITEQTDCTSLKYASGLVYKIMGGSSRSVTVYNEKLGEYRVYDLNKDALTIDVSTPVPSAGIKNCDGSVNAAKFAKFSYRLAWNEAAGVVRLGSDYAGILGMHLAGPVVATTNKATLPKRGVSPRFTPPVTVAPEVATPTFTFGQLLEELPARAEKSKCTP